MADTIATNTSPPEARTPAAPDWSSIPEEIACPLCDYNLRGLIEPRCPECGYQFTWQEILDPTLRTHPYIFEHHPESNFRSFLRTWLSGFRPRRFWRLLHPAQPSVPGRIARYWAIIATIFVGTSMLLTFIIAKSLATTNRIYRPSHANWLHSSTDWKAEIVLKHGSVEQYLDYEFPVTIGGAMSQILFDLEASPAGLVILGLLAWPWASTISLMVYQFSMRRARVHNSHLMRITCYSSDTILVVCMYAWPYILLQALEQGQWIPTGSALLMSKGLVVIFAASALFWLFRLAIACKYYLNFQHPYSMVLASQIIAFLSLCVVTVILVVLTR